MASMRIEGLDQVIANLKALPAAIAGKNGGPIRAALYQAAKVIRDDARARCPVDPDGVGAHLRDQIILKRDPNPRAIDNAAERYIVTVKYKAKKYKAARAVRGTKSAMDSSTYQNFGDFYYWRFLEFGTSKMAPRPFLRPAFEANKNALTGIVVAQLATSIAAAVRAMNK